ncbi:MAG: TetR/AcrR family transcriptional regulator [Stenotrophobium sp.]
MNQQNKSKFVPEAASQDGRYTRHAARRRDLMDAAVDYVFRHGLSDLSLRPMAEALGITHRTLLHHFSTKEELIERVLAEVRSRQLLQLQEQAQRQGQDVVTMLDESWAQVSAPERLPFYRAFFEIYAVAAKHPERHAEFLDGVVTSWLKAWTKALMAQGLPKTRAEALSTMVHATCRGLLLDLLTTGDRVRVGKAYKLLHGFLQNELAAIHNKDR